jgi:hypothetical protein
MGAAGLEPATSSLSSCLRAFLHLRVADGSCLLGQILE